MVADENRRVKGENEELRKEVADMKETGIDVEKGVTKVRLKLDYENGKLKEPGDTSAQLPEIVEVVNWEVSFRLANGVFLLLLSGLLLTLPPSPCRCTRAEKTAAPS